MYIDKTTSSLSINQLYFVNSSSGSRGGMIWYNLSKTQHFSKTNTGIAQHNNTTTVFHCNRGMPNTSIGVSTCQEKQPHTILLVHMPSQMPWCQRFSRHGPASQTQPMSNTILRCFHACIHAAHAHIWYHLCFWQLPSSQMLRCYNIKLRGRCAGCQVSTQLLKFLLCVPPLSLLVP